MASETLKEFLVSIGWQSNEAQQRKFIDAIEGATLRAKILGDVIEATARKVFDAITGMAESFDRLYFSTQRTGTSAATIKDFAYAVGQLGGSADAAQASLEAMGRKLRQNPGNLTWLNALGFGLNKNTKQLEYQRDLAEKAAKMPLATAEQYRALVGLDENTFLAMRKVAEIERLMDESAKSRGAAGLDPDQAARDANAFMSIWRKLELDLGNLADALYTKLMKALAGPLKELDDFLAAHEQEIGEAINKVTSAIGDMTKAWVDSFERWVKDPRALEPMFKGFHDFADDLVAIAKSLHGLVEDLKWLIDQSNKLGDVLNAISNPFGSWGTRNLNPDGSIGNGPLPGNLPVVPYSQAGGITGWIANAWQNRPALLGGAPALGAANATGKWWTPERMQHAAERLEKEAGLSPMGAAGLVARWAGVESAGGPTSLNPRSGAFGVGQWLGDRLPGIAGNTDFDAQLSHAIGELNGPESRAASQLRSAKTPGEGARGASMFERAEGYSSWTGTDNFTSQTPVSSVYGAIHGAAASGAFVIGDSLGVGVKGALGASGIAKEGMGPGWVLDQINGLSAAQAKSLFAGKTIILSGGASNDPSKAGLVADQVKALVARGVDPKNIRVLGVGDRGDFAGVNDQLQSIAAAAGATFIPLGPLAADHVHSSDYKGLAAAALAASAASKQSIWNNVNPNWFAKPGAAGSSPLMDYFNASPFGTLGPQSSNTTINNVNHKVDISVDGAEDPSIVARMVALNQSRAALDLTRNLQGATG